MPPRLPRRADGTLDTKGFGAALRWAFAKGAQAIMPTVKLPEPAATEQPHVANEEFAEAIGKVRDATTQLEVVANLGSQPPDRAHAESIAEALRRLSGDISQ